jgi:hypothetical protein
MVEAALTLDRRWVVVEQAIARPQAAISAATDRS